MDQLAEYQESFSRVVVTRDGDYLVFWSDFDDNGKSITSQSRMPVADYVAKGEGPWPWYDLRDRRAGALQVFDALGLPPQPWTEPLSAAELDLFDRARDGRASIGDLLALPTTGSATGLAADTIDHCGASPLWYAVRSLDHQAALVLLEAGADPGRRIELSALGDRFTTILHEIVLMGRTVALDRALARGADLSLLDSDGATPMHRLDDRSDHVNPSLTRALVASGADVNASTASGETPVEAAARRILPATVATMLELGALPGRALTALLTWWVLNVRWAGYRATDVADVAVLLRAGGADVTERDRELAAEAGVPTVVAALDA